MSAGKNLQLHQASGQKLGLVMRKLIITNYFKADGSINGQPEAPFGESQIDTLINLPDFGERWKISDTGVLAIADRADNVVETIDSIDVSTAQGTKTVSISFLCGTPALAEAYNQASCDDLGFMGIDDCNSLIAYKGREGFIDPIKIARGTMWAKYVDAAEGVAAKVVVTFQLDKTVKDSQTKLVTQASHGTNLLDKIGLTDVFISNVSSPGLTSVKLDYNFDNNTFAGVPFTGLVFGEFTVTNTDSGAPIAVSAAVEAPDGTYVLTVAAQSGGENFSTKATKAGFDFQVGTGTF